MTIEQQTPPCIETPIVFGAARFTVYDDTVIRLEFRADERFPETASILTAAELPTPCPAQVAICEKTLVLATKQLRLTYTDDGKPFHQGNLRIEHPTAHRKATWRPGDGNQPLVTMVRSLDQWSHDPNFSREEHPGLLNRQGRMCIEDEPQLYRTPNDQWVTTTPLARRGQDWWFFGYGKNFVNALQQFVGIFGPIPMIPRWALGFWYSRWFEFHQDEIVNIVHRYRDAGLPMDVMVVDTNWREQGWIGYNWHSERFPEPERLLNELHDLGLAVSLNDHPSYDCVFDSPLPENDRLLPEVQQRLHEPPWKGEWACNWASQSCVAVWKNVVLSAPIKMGVDCWWVDGWGESPFRATKGQFWTNLHYFDVVEKTLGKRGLILSRWGGWGSHRYPVQFSGDTYSTWETLNTQIRLTADSAGAAACYWSHDIGGFHLNKLPDDMYIRWIQFGAFSPIFRTHSASGTREPFAYSELAQQVFKQVVNQRYALNPYLYNAAHEAHVTGLPLCRPLYLHYPEYEAAYQHRLQYLLGRDILVVPGNTPGEVCTRPVWMPPGEWIRPETGEIFEGNSTRSISIPLAEIPLFYRNGAIIPHHHPGNTTRDGAQGPLYLDIYLMPLAHGALIHYEDDGESNDYLQGKYTLTAITGEHLGTSIEVHVGQPEGKYRAHLREYVMNVWLQDETAVQTVLVNGKTLPADQWEMTNSYAADTCNGRVSFLRFTCPPSTNEWEISIRFCN